MKHKITTALFGTIFLCGLFAINAFAVETPSKIVFNHHSTGVVESATISAYSSSGNMLWSHETGSYSCAQLDRVSDIGTNGDQYFYCEDGTIIALDVYTGDMNWVNGEFEGSPIDHVFDDEGVLYVCGYLGPDLFAVTPDGETVIDAGALTADLFWPYDLEWTDHTQQVLTIYYEGGIDEYEGGAVEYVDVWSLMMDYMGATWYHDQDEYHIEHIYEPVYADEAMDAITLYVVNCNQSITLRISPSSSSAEICQIPLGAPVSYQYYGANGFYYVNYNGYMGYAASAYLSENPTVRNPVCQVVNCRIIKVFEGLPNFLRGNREGLVDFFNELMRVFREGPV